MRARPRAPGSPAPGPARSSGSLNALPARPIASEQHMGGALGEHLGGGRHRRRHRGGLWEQPTPLVLAVLLAAAWAGLMAAVVFAHEMESWAARRVGALDQESAGHAAALWTQESSSQLAADAASAVEAGPANSPDAAGATEQPSWEHGEQAQAEEDQEVLDMQLHVAQQGPAGSFWPAGCRWREAARPPPATPGCMAAPIRRGELFGGVQSVWRCHAYDHWSEGQQAWVDEQPAACRLQAAVPLADWAADRAAIQLGNASLAWHSSAPASTWSLEVMREHQQRQQEEAAGGEPVGTEKGSSAATAGLHPADLALGSADLASDVRCAAHYCILRNLYYHDGRFFFLADPHSSVQLNSTWQLTRNREGQVLSVRNVAEFSAGVRAQVVTGETLLLDYVFYLHPTALGHWLEALLPVFSILRREPLVRRTPDRVLMLFQQRANVNDWVRSLMAAVLGVRPGQPLPPLLFQAEHAEPVQQPQQLLEGARPGEWLLFEQVLWPRDVFMGGHRGCRDSQDARALRALIYAMHGLPLPSPRGPPPPVITLQRKSANRRLLNEAEVVGMLRGFGEVRVVEYGSGSTFAEQVRMAASTGVYVSVHTSNLANSLLLPPGAAVFEILQRNWMWADIDQFFSSLTAQLGDVHHYALRAQGRNETFFLSPRLDRLFGNWSAARCWGQDCVEALTLVDVRVDVPALRQLVASRLELVRAGAGVEEAALPWPGIPADDADTGQQRGSHLQPQEQQQERPKQAAGHGSSVQQLAKRLLDVNPAPDTLPPQGIW